jgi:formylglycine-generating enzyme required for sulfatase activity
MQGRGQHTLLLAAVCFFALPTLAQSLKPGTVFKDCSDCPDMVVVPTGTFTMGITPGEAAQANLPAEEAAREQPAHIVTIANPIAVARTELTVAAYAAFAAETNRATESGCTTWDVAQNKWGEVAEANWEYPGYPQTPDYPVGCITLDDARDYAKWLSAKTHHHYRVPSEAEWEYVARAGGTVDTIENICAKANVSDNARLKVHGKGDGEATRFILCDDGFVYAAPVGKFPPNDFGLLDVIGNIWEWTDDCFVPNYDGAPVDGSALKTQACDRYVVRGGGWYSRSWFARPAGRSREVPGIRMSTLGLRVVRDLTN